MKLLALETSTEACSAALAVDGVIVESFQVAPRAHTELILAMVDRLLADAGLTLRQLDRLAFGRGPGAFTGVRIGTGVVQGLAYALDLPVVPISTLAALADGARRESGARRVLAAIDARMGEVYWGAFQVADDGVLTALGEECVCPPHAVELPPDDGWHGVGTGWGAYPDALGARLGPKLAGWSAERWPRARDVAALALDGVAVAAAEALPVYLRDQVVARPGQG